MTVPVPVVKIGEKIPAQKGKTSPSPLHPKRLGENMCVRFKQMCICFIFHAQM
jgi:hypothetical protein